MTTLVDTPTPLERALNEASRHQLAELEARTGMPIRRLRTHNTPGLAGWIKRETADILGFSVGKLFPDEQSGHRE